MSFSEFSKLKSERRINIVQGEQHVDSDPHVVLTTILGSCVATCLWDPMIGLGGMNHFLLPGDQRDAEQGMRCDAMRYGVYAMELLVNGLLRRGAQRKRLQAKLFGGACMMKGLTDVGNLNATFAERFLQTEGVTLAGGSLRGDQGRRIQFWPATGRARQILLTNAQGAFQIKLQDTPAKLAASSGTVELF